MFLKLGALALLTLTACGQTTTETNAPDRQVDMGNGYTATARSVPAGTTIEQCIMSTDSGGFGGEANCPNVDGDPAYPVDSADPFDVTSSPSCLCLSAGNPGTGWDVVTTTAEIEIHDCDDSSATVYAGAAETCDGVDNDCDTFVDETGGMTTYYADSDGDTFGDLLTTSTACDQPGGYVVDNTDCNDGNIAINPDATENCDGIDNDCSGYADDNLDGSSGDVIEAFVDGDGDTFGTAPFDGYVCTLGSNQADNTTDCNDADASVHPDAPETCNLTDDDCDGSTDEGVTTTFYQDSDSDLYGNLSATTAACSAPVGYVSNSTDCDDTTSARSPANAEICDIGNVDEDCDGNADDLDTTGAAPTGKTTWYADMDSDMYGSATSIMACDQSSGYVANATDCSDIDASVHPGASDSVCNGVDNDCDGGVDEDATFTNYYTDGDVDGYGAGSATSACSAQVGMVTNVTDCNDASGTVHPGASETCNETDDDCDGSTDEGVQTTYFADADADTYGNLSATSAACSAPAGYVSNSTDCNDGNASAHPFGVEVCDGVDQDCDSIVDDGVTSATYTDADSDGYGDEMATSSMTCITVGHVTNNMDCNDINFDVNPGAEDVDNNGLDDDCDNSAIDEVCAEQFYSTKSWRFMLSDLTTFEYTPDDPDWQAGYAQGMSPLCASFLLTGGHDLKFQAVIDYSGNGVYGDSNDKYGFTYPSTNNFTSMTIMGMSVDLRDTSAGGDVTQLPWVWGSQTGDDGSVIIEELPN